MDIEQTNQVEPVETLNDTEVTEDRTTEDVSEVVDPQEKMNSVVAAVKKEFRKKGYNEGYEQAKRELSEDEPSEPSQEPVTPQYNNLRDYEIAQAGKRIRARGLRKFKDFDENIQKLLNTTKKNPTLRMLVERAVEMEDADLVYKISKDRTFRGKLLNSDIDNWDTAFYEEDTSNNSPGKNPPEPIAPLSTKPVVSNGSEQPSDKETIAMLRRQNLLR